MGPQLPWRLQLRGIVNPEIQYFIRPMGAPEIRRFLVDKSLLLRELISRLDTPEGFLAVSRPSGWGKSRICAMVTDFFSRGTDGSDFFSGMAVARTPGGAPDGGGAAPASASGASPGISSSSSASCPVSGVPADGTGSGTGIGAGAGTVTGNGAGEIPAWDPGRSTRPAPVGAFTLEPVIRRSGPRIRRMIPEDHTRHMNRHDVIFLDMRWIDGICQEFVRQENVMLGDPCWFVQYLVVRELAELYPGILRDWEVTPGDPMIPALEKVGMAEPGRRYVLVVDDWDLLLFQGTPGSRERWRRFLTDLLETPRGRRFFSLVLLTGRSPVPRNSDGISMLPSFRESTMLDPELLGEFFGFTRQETEELASRIGSPVTGDLLCSWYEGYQNGGLGMMNPRHVMSSLITGSPVFPLQTGSGDDREFLRLVSGMDWNYQQELIQVLEGRSVRFTREFFRGDIQEVGAPENIWCVLLCRGFLGSITAADGETVAAVPNFVMSYSMYFLIREQEWARSMPQLLDSGSLLESLEEGRLTVASVMLTDILRSVMESMPLVPNILELFVSLMLSRLKWRMGGVYQPEVEFSPESCVVALVPLEVGGDRPVILGEFSRDIPEAEVLAGMDAKLRAPGGGILSQERWQGRQRMNLLACRCDLGEQVCRCLMESFSAAGGRIAGKEGGARSPGESVPGSRTVSGAGG